MCALVALAFAACGPVTSPLTGGTYALAAGQEPAGATLTVDAAAKQATLTRPGAADVTLTLAPVDQASWVRGCPANFSSVLLETFDVSPRPLEVGPATLATPRLLAGCGLDVANADEVSLESGDVKLLFRRR